MESVRILLLDPPPARVESARLRNIFVSSLNNLPFQVQPCAAPPRDRAHWEEIDRRDSDIVFFIAPDGSLGSWLESLQHRRNLPGAAPLIAVLNDPAPLDVAALLQTGVADFVMPPLSWGQVMPRVMRLLPRSRLHPPARPVDRPHALDQLVGNSPAFEAELNKLPVIAACEAGVLIQGETGTGKEVFARAIHDLSTRRGKPFVAVNCGTIPVDLIESEFFGHERGAFTGAYATQKGLIAQADGGTLFLDEVGSLPLLAQVKLLRFLQEKEYRPLGAAAARPANVRVIAAANAELEREIGRGTFRQDLYYRLNIIRVTLPPLRERREDIAPLARHFLAKYATRFGRGLFQLSTDAAEKLICYAWPGNVRELEHVIERAVVFCTHPTIHGSDLAVPGGIGAGHEEPFQQAKARTVALFERHYIESLLAAHRGNISSAARRAGKNRRAFWQLIRKHCIEVDRFRSVNSASLPQADPAF